MAVFSDLPNELIINIWGYVVEPQSVENFALVSKRVYELATPFVEEHQRLRQQYPKILDLETGKHGRAADLLGVLPLNPRVALYINELQFRVGEDIWEDYWEDQDEPIQNQSYAGTTMDIFEEEIWSLSLIDRFEAEYWVKMLRSWHEGPLLTLILIRLTELKKFVIYPCYNSDRSLEMVVGVWLRSLERLAHPRRSTSESESHPDNGALLQLKEFSQISDLMIKHCDIPCGTILQLLRSTKKLKRFNFYGKLGSSVHLHQICSGLLECSRQSLQSLCLRVDDQIVLGKNRSLIRDAISRFEILLELEIDIIFLLDNRDDDCKTLIDMLPISIKTVSLSSIEMVAHETVRGTILQMIKRKVAHLPNLKALTFELSLYLEPQDDTPAPVTRTELRDQEPFADLSRKSAEVGVFLSATKYEYPVSWKNQAVFQACMS